MCSLPHRKTDCFKPFCLHSQFMFSLSFTEAFSQPLLCVIMKSGWYHHDSAQWRPPVRLAYGKNRNRAIDISYYRFLFSCQPVTSLYMFTLRFSNELEAKDQWNRCVGETLRVYYTCCQVLSFISAVCIDSLADSSGNVFFFAGVFPSHCSFLFSFCVCVCVFVFLAGIRSWDTNLIDCNLDQELKLFVSRHSARFSADVRGKLDKTFSLLVSH